MFTARYERFRTRTLVLRTADCTTGETLHGDPAGVNFASTLRRARGTRGPPPQDRPPRGTGLVETRQLRAMGRRPDGIGIRACLLRDGEHGRGELVERRLALRLGRFDHESAPHHE